MPPLLEVESLRVAFHTRNGVYRAVNDVSFTLARGETLGIVGESGSGKSVTCYALLGLLPRPPARIEGGRATFGADGLDLLHATSRELADVRGRRAAMIFQDPMTSLNPYLRVEEQLTEPLRIHSRISGADARVRALAALREVGIQDPERRLRAYPHEFSGGMRQRVMIAMALISQPELLIADEPTTALDVTVQAQILDLIKRLQRDHGTAVLFVTHDLGVVSGVCDRVLVMYAGRVVETAPVDALFHAPKHPYNLALQRSIPALQPKGTDLYTVPGLPPDLSKPLPGCPFSPRCEFARPGICQEPVQLAEVTPGHWSACTRVQRGELRLRDEGRAAAVDDAFLVGS